MPWTCAKYKYLCKSSPRPPPSSARGAITEESSNTSLSAYVSLNCALLHAAMLPSALLQVARCVSICMHAPPARTAACHIFVRTIAKPSSPIQFIHPVAFFLLPRSSTIFAIDPHLQPHTKTLHKTHITYYTVTSSKRIVPPLYPSPNQPYHDISPVENIHPPYPLIPPITFTTTAATPSVVRRNARAFQHSNRNMIPLHLHPYSYTPINPQFTPPTPP